MPEREQSGGLVEFQENRFSVRSAIQSLFIPPDWERYSDSAMMQREEKILGSFDRAGRPSVFRAGGRGVRRHYTQCREL